MKKTSILVIALWTSAFLLPLAAYGASNKTQIEPVVTEGTFTLPQTTGAASEEPPAVPNPYKIDIMIDGVLTQFELEDAVASIVAAEMPALFPEQALRAQAVAARTYILYKKGVTSSAHPSAVICDNPSCCCALADLDTLAASWGANGGEYINRILSAVGDTAGQILVYDSAPALTVFHSMSGARTDSAEDIWGKQILYLVSVDAPVGESELSGYIDSVIVSKADFKAAFLVRYPEAVLENDSDSWFKNFVRASSGTILSVEVGGVTVDGMSVRFMCGLKSANFTVTQGSDRLLFESRGYGHGVGMSQNGAKVLALKGYNYREILAFYYSGTELVSLE